jgi:hypothetical protein
VQPAQAKRRKNKKKKKPRKRKQGQRKRKMAKKPITDVAPSTDNTTVVNALLRLNQDATKEDVHEFDQWFAESFENKETALSVYEN